MNPFDYIRKLVEPNRTSRFQVKPDSKLSRNAGLLAAFDGSPEMLGAPFTTGGIAPSSMNLSLRDYDMDSEGLKPKEQKSAVNMEQPKQVQNRLSENKSSDLSGKDIVKGLLKGLGAAAIGGMIGGESGVAAASNILRAIEAKKQQRVAEQVAKVREQQRMERTDTDRRMKEAEMGLKLEDLDIKREGMRQKAFNEGMGKTVDKIGGGLKAVFDYFKPPTEEQVLKRQNLEKTGQQKDLSIDIAKARLAGTLPSARKSGGSGSGGVGREKVGKSGYAVTDFINASPEDQELITQKVMTTEGAGGLENFMVKVRSYQNRPHKPGKAPSSPKRGADEEGRLMNQIDREMLKWRIENPSATPEEESEKLNNVKRAYAPLVNKARAKKAGAAPAAAPAGSMPSSAMALIEEMRKIRGQ
jgi:hypothetical protein